MRLKVLGMALMLCICGTVLSAQEAEPLVLLYSGSTIWYTALVQPPPICSCFPTQPLPKKQESTLSVDILVLPLWDTVKEDRIQNRTIQFGGSATPWTDTVMFNGWPVPRVNFASSDFRTTIEGGVMRTRDENISRTMGQVRGVLEGSVWRALVGADMFFGQEQIPLAFRGVNFDADFRRRSSGAQGWLGVKVGNFNRSFIAARYGRGYARTEGTTRFNVPDIGDTDRFPLYLEQFRTVSFSVEGKARAKRISQSVRLDRVEYERIFPSPDPLHFDENQLQDMWLRAETEVIPFSRLRFLRGVVIFTKDFRDRNRLMFINDYSSLRVLLRLSKEMK